MAVKIYKPTSPGRRGMTSATFEEITRSKPERSLLRPVTVAFEDPEYNRRLATAPARVGSAAEVPDGKGGTVVRTFSLVVGCVSTVLGLFWGYPFLSRLL